MPSIKPYEVGQTVLVADGYGYHAKRTPLREGTVEKVGRTLVHVRLSSWEVARFTMATGVEGGDSNYPRRITTEKQEAERVERHETHQRLGREFGISGRGLSRLNLAEIREVERIVREAYQR